MRKSILVIVTLMSFMLSGCTIYLKNENEIINESGYEKEYVFEDNEDIEELKIDCVLGIGEFSIEGGGDKLVQANFKYSNKAWEPEIEDNLVGSMQNVRIKNPSVTLNSLNNYNYEWDLNLSNQKLTSLDLDLGIGEGNLDFTDINLNNLTIQMGVGDVTLNLRKDYERDINVHVDGGVGKLKILLPKDIGVKAEVSGGIKAVLGKNVLIKDNTYYNDAFQDSDHIVDIDIVAGIGQIELLVEE